MPARRSERGGSALALVLVLLMGLGLALLYSHGALIFEQRSKVLLVPEQAIVPDTKTPFVFVVPDGKAMRVPVKTGLRRNAQVEIVEGTMLTGPGGIDPNALQLGKSTLLGG